jgi:HPt (histidine-containing phosphotransfer) domain-containing protein
MFAKCGRTQVTARTAAIVNVSGEEAVALDVQHLNSNTFGDRMLRAEIIMLFNTQLEQSRAHLLRAETAQDWRFLTHTLKGAASAVGAIAFARLAERWEAEGLPQPGTDRSQHLVAYDSAWQAFLLVARGTLD